MPEDTSTWDKIKNVAASVFGTKTPEKLKGTGFQRPVTKEMEAYDREAIRSDRRSKIVDVSKMMAVDSRVGRIMWKLPSDAVVGYFSIVIQSASSEAEKTKAEIVINKLIDKCDVKMKTQGWIKGLLRDGDLFLEIIVDDKSREIVRLKKLAAIITNSNMNSEGNFPEGKSAYWQEHPYTRQEIKTFEPWQIAQISWDYEDGKPYGEPLMAPSRLAYERLDKGEKNLVARRSLRAGLIRHHKVGTEESPGDWADVEKYRADNKDTLDNPMNPVQDFFTNGVVDIKNLSGDTTLGDIEDIMHFEGQLPMNAGVPSALLSGGREKSINRDVLDEQTEDYYRVIDQIDFALEQGLRKIFSFALLLAGINDEAVKYTINWGAKDRDDIDAKIARAKELQALGFSFETILSICDLDGVEFEEEQERIRTQVEEGAIPYGVGMKLDPNILLLLGMVAGGGEKSELSSEVAKLRNVAEDYLSGDKDGSMKKVLALKSKAQ